MTPPELVLMQWDDEYDQHEVESSDETVLAERLAELDGVRRTLVTIYREAGHMACAMSASLTVSSREQCRDDPAVS